VVLVQGLKHRLHRPVGAALEEDREAAGPLAGAQGATTVEIHRVEDIVKLQGVPRHVRDVVGAQQLGADVGERLLVQCPGAVVLHPLEVEASNPGPLILRVRAQELQPLLHIDVAKWRALCQLRLLLEVVLH